MANYSRLKVSSLLFPSIYDEVAIFIGTAIGLIFSSIYSYTTNYDLYNIVIKPKIVDPLSQFFLRYRLPDFASHATTFLALAAIGLVIYFGIYLLMNNLILIRNEATYGSFKHPTSHWHHWGKFFSVEAAKLILSVWFLIGLVLLIHPVITGLLSDLNKLFNDKPTRILPTLRDVGLVLLTLNGLVVIYKTIKHLRLG